MYFGKFETFMSHSMYTTAEPITAELSVKELYTVKPISAEPAIAQLMQTLNSMHVNMQPDTRNHMGQLCLNYSICSYYKKKISYKEAPVDVNN